ncbi:MAG TPA: alpha/beta fold hydrolase [Actinomycetota bacterium]|nr:alpha/beta fold hydrolase [Actinomycetota bacterium]
MGGAAARLARQDVAWERIGTLPGRFRRPAAEGLTAEIQITVDDRPFTISIVDGECFVRRGKSIRADTRIDTDVETWLSLDDGVLVTADLFLGGRLRVRGNVDLAVRMQALFEPHGRERTVADLQQVTVRANGVALSAYMLGEGPPLLLLHGLGGAKVSWMPLLAPLSERYRVIAPDLPGHGESDKPRQAEYSPRYYAAVVRKLMDTLDARSAHVVGNSMGGRVALELAARSPKRIRGLALLDPALPGLRWRWFMGFMQVAPVRRGLGAIPFPANERWGQLMLRRLFAQPDRFPRHAYEAGADEFARVYRSARARLAFWASLRHVIYDSGEEFWRLIGRVQAPTLILWGERDRLVPLRLGNQLARAIPHAEYLVLPDVGHVPQFEAPKSTSQALGRFLHAIDAAGDGEVGGPAGPG